MGCVTNPALVHLVYRAHALGSLLALAVILANALGKLGVIDPNGCYHAHYSICFS